MTITDVVSIAATILAALGGGGALVFSLSSWLGKIWADRLMARETAKYESAIAELQSNLRRVVDTELATHKNELDIYKDKHLKSHNDKIECYRLVVDIVVEVLGDLDFFFINGAPVENEIKRRDEMNRGRMRAYGYLAMLAPQEVMNAYDDLSDHLLFVINGQEPYEWTKVRELSLAMLNEVRKEIGLGAAPIAYFGKL